MTPRRAILQFDWEQADGLVLTDLVGQQARRMNDGSGRWAAVALLAGDRAVVIRVDEDTDELSVALEDPPRDDEGWTPIAGLSRHVGRPLGWCWAGRNYRGYLDAFMVAFDGIDPDCVFVGVASDIAIKTLNAVPA